MKTFMKYILILIGFTLFATSCTDRDYAWDDNGTTDYVTFSAATVTDAGVTRADTLSKGDMGVYCLAENGYTACNNIKYSHSASGWTSANPIQVGSDSASICAYYPYGVSGVTDAVSPTAIPLKSQLYSREQDVCFMQTKKISNAMLHLPMKMQRAYSQITFIISHDDTYTGKCAINEISIANDSIRKEGHIDITKGTYNNVTKDTVKYVPGIDSISVGKKDTTSVLMVPVTEKITKATTLKFKIDGSVKTVSLSATDLSKLEPGVNYQISISIRSNVIVVIDAPVLVTRWQTLKLDVLAGYDGELKSYYPESNCYIVSPNDSICIPISQVKGNPQFTDSLPSSWDVELLWSDCPAPLTATGAVASVKADHANNLIIVKTGSGSGNSVICIGNPTTKEIYWSWHIWTTTYNPNATTYTYNGLVWMSRNIGALSETAGNYLSYGTYYQWGRKDPFPGPNGASSNTTATVYNKDGAIGLGAAGVPSVDTNGNPVNILTSIRNPFMFYLSTNATGGNWNSATNIWGNPAIGSYTEKTKYDPCPVGWRTPYSALGGPWDGLAEQTFNYGMTWSAIGYYPGAGIREKSTAGLNHVGIKMAYYSATSLSLQLVLVMAKNNWAGQLFYNNAPCDTGSAFVMRCVKE